MYAGAGAGFSGGRRPAEEGVGVEVAEEGVHDLVSDSFAFASQNFSPCAAALRP